MNFQKHQSQFFHRTLVIFIILISSIHQLQSQIENVPIENQVYEFLNRLGVKGILKLYSNTMIPLSRKEVAELLKEVEAQRDNLTDAEVEFFEKFKREFVHEFASETEDVQGLFNDGNVNTMVSDKEKYLYTYPDTTFSLYLEFIGSVKHQRVNGDGFGSSQASFETHGARVRGTIKRKFGYFIQATNGTFFGDRLLALSDSKLRGNVKFKDLNAPYFDFTEAYIRADLDWFNVQFGREFQAVGTGYSGRFILSDHAPVFDFLKIDARYRSLRFIYLHGSLLGDSVLFPGIQNPEPPGSNKYFALHRLQISLFNLLNFGISEMVIYRRFTPEFAYLNPINFFKSSEHSLRDRDNAFLNFDLELFPVSGVKWFGSLLVDDIDFSKIGTGWWGNELGWQSGLYMTDLMGLPDLDGVIEYARVEPYVYTHRYFDNNYSNNNIGVGHHLEPNSDEWFIQVNYRPTKKLRSWLTYSGIRHGDNIMVNGQVVKNVGGNILQGHRAIDGEYVRFLDGNLTRRDRYQIQLTYEFINNFFVTGRFELHQQKFYATSQKVTDRHMSIQFQIEY